MSDTIRPFNAEELSAARTRALANSGSPTTETLEERTQRGSQGLSEAIVMDQYILDLKSQLSKIDFDDPEYDRVSKLLDAAYSHIADGNSHHVPF